MAPPHDPLEDFRTVQTEEYETVISDRSPHALIFEYFLENSKNLYCQYHISLSSLTPKCRRLEELAKNK
ncbi:predicted protein [Sclerotinia sclerotiorum 1980 UF-70]|uniref:Uncharacterized protein n=1 Tax=Sclerotinia sclerotiorum (strain ATCC 18683 / 1980 / Ss-1) TaxID=665079 RepID=A7EZZ7_SCLS1|nr:predicted protein [Sclerotinia sclerotiorum 1980 UF-70]EDN95039.1 predicted protein [Sclerotinia sclerotiorum 1980 UF-70]